MKRAKAYWMGASVQVFEDKGHGFNDPFLKSFVAGSRNMCQRMALWAKKNKVKIVNLKKDKQGKLRVYV